MSEQNELNGKKENPPKLTIEELKEFKGFEGISEKEAIDYIESMSTFSMIVFELYNNKPHCNE
jgi:hypothetical protein